MSRRSLIVAGAALIGVGALASGIAVERRLRRGTPFLLQAPVRQAWLEQHCEKIIEPDLPIIDPHHHLWDRPGDRYLLQDCLSDIRSGHNIRATLFEECGAMYRSTGPRELRSLGETEFAANVSRSFASGQYGSIQCCAGIVGNGSCSYQVLWNAFKRIVGGYSADEKTALFSGAASKAYRISI